MGTHNREYNGILLNEKHGRWRWSYTLGTNIHDLRGRGGAIEDIAVG